MFRLLTPALLSRAMLFFMGCRPRFKEIALALFFRQRRRLSF
jgi:hypothetical protein